MGIFDIFKKKQKIEESEPISKNLYILNEFDKPGIVAYLNANDIKVKRLTCDLSTMFLALIREKSPIRLLVIDYGISKYKTLEAIEELVGLISTYQNDEAHNAVTVFTQSGAIRKSLKEHNIDCDIREYRGMSDITKALRSYNEIYVSDGAVDIQGESTGELLNFRMKKLSTNSETEDKLVTVETKFRDLDNLNITKGSAESSLETFKCKF